MSLLYFKLDQRAIQKYLEERVASAPEVQAKVNQVIASLFGRAHQALMKNFLEHPVTMELKEGVDASNISNTLNGEGNLFGFLGFWNGQDPTYELEDLLTKINYEKSSIRKNVINYRIIGIPSKKDIEYATEMNWGHGTSWAYAIETGIFEGDAALSHYIFKSWGGSRSQAGFQIKGYEYSEETFNATPYISDILSRFQNRVSNANGRFLI